MHRRELIALLDAHETRFMEEAAYVERAREFVMAHEDCFHCDLWPGHVTGSAWVVNPARDHVLLLHHRKHERVRPRNNVLNRSIQRRIGRFSARTEPSVRWCGPVSAD